MTCDDADLLLAAHAVGALEASAAPALRAHLRQCPRCQKAGSAYVATASLLPLALDPVTPPPELRSRILAVVHAEAAGRGSARQPWWRRLWNAVPSSRTWSATGLAGLAAATALAIWTFAVPHGPSPTAPLSTHACGLTAQPTACGTLTYLPASREAVLTVQGLAPIPVVDGRPTGVYEVWLIRRNGAAQPAAFLVPAPERKVWTAAIVSDVGDAIAVATTLEPPGGSPQPTGTEVLRLPLPSTTQ